MDTQRIEQIVPDEEATAPPPTLDPGPDPNTDPDPAPTAATVDLFATQASAEGSATVAEAPPGPGLPETQEEFATRCAVGEGVAATVDSAGAGLVTAPGHETAPAPPAPMRYRTLRPHARGGLGEVFVALDEELGREVALKEIQGRHADRDDSRLRFLIEAEVTGGLEHPGIVPVYGLGQYPDGRPYYAMRFIRGRTLKEAIDAFHEADETGRDPGRRTLELRELLNRLIDVCNALGYAHSRGILHRDIKPANIMLGAFGETLVVDWGLAKTLDRPETLGESELRPLRPLSAGHSGGATLYGSTVGTPQFMSPEQAAGELDRLGPASDVYSLGVTLYCILVGRPPFDEPQLALLLNKVRRGTFPHPRQVDRTIPPALEAICLKAMALRPEDRYRTARALAGDLEAWLADEPVSAYREPWTARLARWARRHRTVVTSSAALVLTALVALSIGTVMIGREQARTEANFRLARDAVDQMLTQLGEVELAEVPQMEPVRKRMLGKALTFYRKFLAERGDDRSIRHETGRADTRLGDIEEMLGDFRAAERAYDRAIARLGSLEADRPGDAGVRRDLAGARHRLGVLLKKSNRFAESEQALRRARRARQQLIADFPGDPDDRRDEMDSVYQLGTLLAKLGRVREVEAAYAEAVDADRKLAAAHPDRPDYPRKLGRYLNNRGMLLQSIGTDPRQAEAAFREALELQGPLADKSPTVAGLQWERARTTNNLAAAREATQGVGQALPVYREALGRFRQLADDFPSVPDYQNELAAVSANLGSALTKQAGLDKNGADAPLEEAARRLDDAVAIYRRLIRPDQFPNRPDYRLKLAQADRKRGMLLNRDRPAEAEAAFREAVTVLAELVAQYPQVPEYQSSLGLALQNLAIQRFANDPVESRRLLEGAIAHQRLALGSNPRDQNARKFVIEAHADLETVLRKLGDHAGAAGAAEALVRLLPDDAGAIYRAARLLDLGATLAAADAKLPEAERIEVVRTRADLALKRLQQALKEGAVVKPSSLDAPAFEAIRKQSPAALERLKKDLEARARPAIG